jgi:zinc protease
MRFVLAAAVAVVPALAVAAPTPAIETFTLDNGLQVAVLPSSTAPVVAVQVWYHVGSKDEPRDRRGVAHALERLMAKGSEHVRADAHAQYITSVGGFVSAQTEEDATHFVDTLPADYLDLALQLEAERMRNLMFRKDALDAEKDVIKDEIRQHQASPIQKGFIHFLEVAFTKHPYAWDAGGRAKDVDALTIDDVKKLYDTYYRPSNALLVVVGKTTVDQVKASAQKWFGSLPKTDAPAHPAKDAAEPEQAKQLREVTEPQQLGLAIVGWHIPPAKHPDIYALQLASIILGAGDSSRLKLKLRAVDAKTKKPLALDGGIEAFVREDPGVIIALGAFIDPAQADAVEAALLGEVARLGAGGPEPGELRKAKNQVQSGYTFGLENAQGLAEAIGKSWILTGDAKTWVRDIDQLEKVSAADIARVIKTYMKPDRATVVVIPPKGR